MSKEKISLSEGFLENIKAMSESELLNSVFEATITVANLKEERDADDKLTAAKQIAKDLNSGYSAAIKYEKQKLKHMVERLQDLRARQELKKQGIQG